MASIVIRVDDEVCREILKRAQPRLGETPNSVLRRLLGLPEKIRQRGRKTAPKPQEQERRGKKA